VDEGSGTARPHASTSSRQVPRTATVTTDSESTVLVLDQRHFTSVIDEVPHISHKIMAVLAGRIRDLDRQIYG